MSRSHRRRRRAIGIGIAAVAAWTTGSATAVGGFAAAPGGRGVGRRRPTASTATGTAAALLVRATTRWAAVGVATVGGWMVTAPAYANEDWDDDDDDGALFDDGFFDEDVEEDDEDDEDADADVSRFRVGETVETTTRPTTSGSGSDAWDAVEAVEIDDEGMDADDDDDDDGSDARDGDAVDGEGSGKKSVLEDLVELGGTQARALLRDLFVEASKFGIDMDGDDDDSDDVDDDDDDDDEFQEEEDAETLALAAQAEAAYEASTELHAVEYDEEEDDSENERAIEQRKKLLLGLGVDVDSEPTPAVVEEATRESNEPEPEVVVAAAKPVEEVKPKVRVDPAKVVEPTRGRSLLSVSDPESYKWLTWDDLPAKIRNRVEAPAQEQADVRVVRVGGYWRAASVNNRQRRKSKSRNGFPLRKSEQDDTPLKECNQRHSVSHIQCFGDDSRYAIITVDAKHSFLPGDYVTFERIDAQNAVHARDINRQYRVWALPAKADADVSKLNWDNIWAASPLATSRQSVFAVAFDTPGVSCDAYPGMNSIVRRSANPRLPYC